MINNKEKKNTQFHHRRVKTDTSSSAVYQTLQPNTPQTYSNRRGHRRLHTQINPSLSSYHQYEYRQFKTGLQTTRTQQKTIRNQNNYNKWFIKPNIRMKRSLIKQFKPIQQNVQFAYNKLYEENILREDCPYLTKSNQRLQILEKIPVHNLRLLENFKKNQQLKKKRVPKIIQLFLKKKPNLPQL